ncbi:MAG: ATP-binding protein [Desulfuromonadaceae bacterium]|nr:ATP-binding protein [Desulfuromonadaceae bacterium]
MASRPGVRARFTLLYGIALIITVVLVSGGIYFFVQRALLGEADNHLRKDYSTIADYVKHDQKDLIRVATNGTISLFTVRDDEHPLVSSDGWNSEKLEEFVTNRKWGELLFSVQRGSGKLYRVMTGTVRINSRNYQIAVAHNADSIRETLKTLALIILLILPIAVAISLAIGYLIAGRVLAPISAITRKAEMIGAENLSERLPVGEAGDEFGRLATVFNQTFARIEDSFERLRRFTADASHELRTPLAAIRSIGETALHPRHECAECREAIGSMLEEADRLTRLVDSLLILSRADGGSCRLNRESTDLCELASNVTEWLNVLAEEKLQTLSLVAASPVYVNVDPETMRQALINLLDNAIKYTPLNGEIRVVVGTTPEGEALLEVIDNGPGIPPEHHDKIFDRFYRVDKGRSREVGGTGLGLSIARWAVEVNNGRLEFESKVGCGSGFRILLPASNGE